MNIIRTTTEADFGRSSDESGWDQFDERSAVRAILINDMLHIALMHVVNEGYYKLPGGGVDEGESLTQALARELHEEAGADEIEIINELGQIVEYREQWERRGIHTCFLVRLKGDLHEPDRTEKELQQGYSVVWAKSIDEAISLVESGQPQQYGQDFEKLRELSFLTYVRNNNLLDVVKGETITKDTIDSVQEQPSPEVSPVKMIWLILSIIFTPIAVILGYNSVALYIHTLKPVANPDEAGFIQGATHIMNTGSIVLMFVTAVLALLSILFITLFIRAEIKSNSK